MQEIVIIGGGYAFWEIHELIEDINEKSPRYKVIGILDDNTALHGTSLKEIPVLGPVAKAKTLPASVKFIFAIGSFRTRIIRSKILEALQLPEERFETLIHPTAKVFSTAKVGHGCIIHYGTVVFNHTRIESFAIIAASCVIAVNNLIGRGSLMGSSITTTTGVKVGPYSFIGSGTNIGENVEIGPGAQVGMGSLILKDVKEGIFVLGNPPRMLDKIDVPADIIQEWEVTKNSTK